MPRKPKDSLRPDTPVEELWNLSVLTAGWLRELGVRCHQDIERADLLATWRALRLRHGQVTRLMYFALWGAKNDCHWNKIPASEKAKFDAQLAALKKEPTTAKAAAKAKTAKRAS
jgi:DNA transformation protein and related proteins